jgi:hypothetical protein
LDAGLTLGSTRATAGDGAMPPAQNWDPVEIGT